MKSFTNAQLLAAAKSHEKDIAEEFESMTEEGDVTIIEHSMGSLADKVRELFISYGLTWTNDEITFANEDTLDKCTELTQKIRDEYESQTGTTWKDLGLGGDDDVDYNSSYPDAIFTTVAHLMK